MKNKFDFDPACLLEIKSLKQRLTANGLELSISCMHSDGRELVIDFEGIEDLRIEWQGGRFEIGEMIIVEDAGKLIVGDELTDAYRWVARGPMKLSSRTY